MFESVKYCLLATRNVPGRPPPGYVEYNYKNLKCKNLCRKLCNILVEANYQQTCLKSLVTYFELLTCYQIATIMQKPFILSSSQSNKISKQTNKRFLFF